MKQLIIIIIIIINVQAGCILQVRYENQLKENQAQKKRLQTISDEEEPGRLKKQKSVDNIRDPETVAVTRLGKKFTVMEMLWLRSARKTFRTIIDDGYNPAMRFENDISKIQGQLRALRGCLPNEYWVMLNEDGPAHNWVSDTVSAQILLKCWCWPINGLALVPNSDDVPTLQYCNPYSCTGWLSDLWLQSHGPQNSWKALWKIQKSNWMAWGWDWRQKGWAIRDMECGGTS